MRTPVLTMLVLALSGTAFGASASWPAHAAPSSVAPAAPRFTLLARSHAPEAITLLSISAPGAGKPGKVIYLDSDGAQQTRPLSEIVALAPPS